MKTTYTRGRIIRLDELGQTLILLLDALCVSSIKKGTRRIIRLDELSSVVRRSSIKTAIDCTVLGEIFPFCDHLLGEQFQI